MEHQWDDPGFAHFLDRLAAFSRLIVFDARGAGLSDRTGDLPPMEEQMDDVLAVLDAAGSSSAAFLGVSQAGPMAVMFAASHPERTRALALYASHATTRQQDDYPWGRDDAAVARFAERLELDWGPERLSRRWRRQGLPMPHSGIGGVAMSGSRLVRAMRSRTS